MSVSQQINIALFSVSLYCRSVSSGLRAQSEEGKPQGPLGWREAETGDVLLLKLLQGQPALSFPIRPSLHSLVIISVNWHLGKCDANFVKYC